MIQVISLDYITIRSIIYISSSNNDRKKKSIRSPFYHHKKSGLMCWLNSIKSPLNPINPIENHRTSLLNYINPIKSVTMVASQVATAMRGP